MSQCDIYCEGEEEGHAHLIITRPLIKEYIVRIHRRGAQKYEIVGTTRSRRKAGRMLSDAMMERGYDFNRGDVLASEGLGSYYEPHVLVEMRR